MKKKILILLVCICLLLFGGCGGKEGYCDIYLDTHNPIGNMMKIDIDDDYTFKDFQKEYTEDGCVVTLYYEK